LYRRKSFNEGGSHRNHIVDLARRGRKAASSKKRSINLIEDGGDPAFSILIEERKVFCLKEGQTFCRRKNLREEKKAPIIGGKWKKTSRPLRRVAPQFQESGRGGELEGNNQKA